jgi:DNA-directed RNA polymerase alpha subunit
VEQVDHPVALVDVADLKLPTRVRTILYGYGIEKIADLCGCTREQLFSLPYMGEASIGTIEKKLRSHGLELSKSRHQELVKRKYRLTMELLQELKSALRATKITMEKCLKLVEEIESR